MARPQALHFDTLCVRAGHKSDPTTGATALPIYQTAGYLFEDSQHAADLFTSRAAGNIYSRIMNPTCSAFEERMAVLEGGVGALGVASGQAAAFTAITTIARAGDEIVSGSYKTLRTLKDEAQIKLEEKKREKS